MIHNLNNFKSKYCKLIILEQIYLKVIDAQVNCTTAAASEGRERTKWKLSTIKFINDGEIINKLLICQQQRNHTVFIGLVTIDMRQKSFLVCTYLTPIFSRGI